MGVGKEWEIPMRQTQKFYPENCFLGMVALQTHIQKIIIFVTWYPFSHIYIYIYIYIYIIMKYWLLNMLKEEDGY